MKRILMLCLIVVIVSMTLMVGIAEPSTPDSILFRNISWYDEEQNVRSVVESISGIKTHWYNGVDEKARIENWYQPWKVF